MKTFIIKLGAVGDIIMTFPAVKYVLKKNEASKITWLCSEKYKKVVQLYDGVDSIITCNSDNLYSNNIFLKILEVLKIFVKLRFKYFDNVYLFHKDPKLRFILFFLRGRRKKYFSIGKSRKNPILDRSFMNEHIRLVSNIDNFKSINFTFPNVNRDLKRIIKDKYVVLSPGRAVFPLSEINLRAWPINYYVELALLLCKKNYKVVITGSNNEKFDWPKNENIISLVGKTDFNELLSLYEHSSFIVTHDSGSFHLAKMSKSNVIGLFGPTNPYRFVGRNIDKNLIVLWGGQKLACSPCHDGDCFGFCKSNKCMTCIKPELVLKQIELASFSKIISI